MLTDVAGVGERWKEYFPAFLNGVINERTTDEEVSPSIEPNNIILKESIKEDINCMKSGKSLDYDSNVAWQNL